MLIRSQFDRRSTLIAVILSLAMILSLSSCASICKMCEVQPDQRITLLNDNGVQSDTIGLLDNLRVRVIDLSPKTKYTLRIVNNEGRTIAHSRLTADRNGEIPATTLLFGENLFSCASLPTTHQLAMLSTGVDARSDSSVSERVLQRAFNWANTISNRQYYVEVLDRERAIRRVPLRIKDDGKPKIYIADSRGCPKGGLTRGKDDVYVIGLNFPAGSNVRLYAVDDQRIWKKGSKFRDITGVNGTPDVENVHLSSKQRHFFVKIWPKELTTTGLYDIIARYTDNERTEIDTNDIITSANDVGLIIQADATGPHIEQNMTVPATDSVLYYLFQDKYFNTDDVWVAINPKDRPGGISGPEQNARIYVVNHLNESQWVDGTSLVDVSSDNYEEVTIKGSCRNQNEVRVWPAPLTNGNYDVVVDFAPFGIYNQGQDIIDELDNVGFQVIDPVPLAIVYPVNGLRVFPEKEVPTGLKRDYIYAVAKIHPSASGTSIYWDSIDIDDPSSDTAPVDPNGPSGNDNRGNYGAAPGAPDGDDGFLDGENASGIATTTTNSGGLAYVTFHVTSQPGDNFTLKASTSPTFTSFDESAPITVWRKLHVETDSMGAPSGTTVTGHITNVNFNSVTNTSQVTVDIVLDDGDPGSTGGRFENGVLTAGGNNYNVVSNTAGVLTVQGNPPNGVSFELRDDDVVPADVEDPDVGDTVRAYARAFILPMFDTGQNTSNVAFDLNTESAERSPQINLTKGTPMSTDDYWTVTVHGGYQEPMDSDNDPDDEGTSRAWALDGVQGVIFLTESVRDWIQAPVAKGGAGGVDPDTVGDLPRSPRMQEIVVHEIGHLLSLEHADGAVTAVDPNGGVMQPSCCPAGGPGTRRSSNFTQKSLHKLRSIVKPD